VPKPLYDRIYQWVLIIAILLFVTYIASAIWRGHA